MWKLEAAFNRPQKYLTKSSGKKYELTSKTIIEKNTYPYRNKHENSFFAPLKSKGKLI